MPSLPALAVDRNLLEHNQLQELLLQRAIEPKVSEIEIEMGPIWLERMLKEQYFIPCSVHAGSFKTKCNRFCLDCIGDAFCRNCLPHHKDHRIVQIRRYSCHKVVKTHDIRRYIDISNILTYTINCGKIVFIDVGPQRCSKVATCCEICCYGRVNSFRFCSLHCKLIAARLKSTKFLPIDPSRQACTLSLLEGTSIEQLDTQKNFNPSQLSSLEDPMSLEDEENLPLQKVLEKCGKRKKQVEQKFTAKTPLATETANLIGSKSPLDLPTSECSRHQINDQERQGQMDVRYGDVEASISSIVEEDVSTSYQKCEQEPKQSEATKDDAVGVLDLHLQLPKGLDKTVTDLHSRKQTKQLNMDGQGKTREKTETSMEDVAGSSNLYAHEQEGLFKPATNQHSQQQIKPEDDTQGRPLKHLKEAKHDATITSDLHHQQQAGSSEPETVVQVRKLIKRGRGRPRKRIRGTKEGQESEETNKKLKKVGRGRSTEQQDVNKEDSPVLLEPAHILEETEHLMDDCPDKSQSEAYEALERGQAMPFSDDDIHQRKKQNLGGGDQPDKQQEELNCHEIEVKQGKSEVESQVRRPKEKSRKSTAIQVPLSSKDQLRSRIKHQSLIRT